MPDWYEVDVMVLASGPVTGSTEGNRDVACIRILRELDYEDMSIIIRRLSAVGKTYWHS